MDKRSQGRRNKRAGDIGEEQAHALLSMMGVNMLQKIATPVKLNPPQGQAARADFFRRVIFKGKVKGDRWGILPNGRSVLAEVKSHPDDRFQYSVLLPHQSQALDEHARNNGLSLLVWVHPCDIFILRWPVPGLEPGKSITLLDAGKLHVDFIQEIED